MTVLELMETRKEKNPHKSRSKVFYKNNAIVTNYFILFLESYVSVSLGL